MRISLRRSHAPAAQNTVERCNVEVVFKGASRRRLIVHARVEAFLSAFNSAFHANQPLTLTNHDGEPFFEFNPRNVTLCEVSPAEAPEAAVDSGALATL